MGGHFGGQWQRPLERGSDSGPRAISMCPIDLQRIQLSKEEPQTMIRKASAEWKGSLKEGKGAVSSESGVLSKAPYSFSTRFENAKGTNPEELIAAAHAGCFTMALAAQLGNAGITPESLETNASLTLDKLDAGWTVTKIHLDVAARIPGDNKAAFEKAAEEAKKNCPISRLLKAEITMSARLLSERATSA
jgi:lipoyl-dependent peroxiredoxin